MINRNLKMRTNSLNKLRTTKFIIILRTNYFAEELFLNIRIYPKKQEKKLIWIKNYPKIKNYFIITQKSLRTISYL